MFNFKTILIVEANAYDAMDLSAAVEERDGHVAGPASTAAEALAILERESIGAAVVDCDLPNGDAMPLVMLLTQMDVPIVIQASTTLPHALSHLNGRVAVLRKPVEPRLILDRLFIEMDNVGSLAIDRET